MTFTQIHAYVTKKVNYVSFPIATGVELFNNMTDYLYRNTGDWDFLKKYIRAGVETNDANQTAMLALFNANQHHNSFNIIPIVDWNASISAHDNNYIKATEMPILWKYDLHDVKINRIDLQKILPFQHDTFSTPPYPSVYAIGQVKNFYWPQTSYNSNDPTIWAKWCILMYPKVATIQPFTFEYIGRPTRITAATYNSTIDFPSDDILCMGYEAYLLETMDDLRAAYSKKKFEERVNTEYPTTKDDGAIPAVMELDALQWSGDGNFAPTKDNRFGF